MSDTAGTETPATEQQPHGADGEGEQTAETPTIEDLQAALEEAKKESRKWESRSKANKTAAEELDALKRASMTDAEKVQADLTAASTRADEAEARAAAAEAALARYKIATEFGLSAEDAEALEAVTDEDALKRLAERLSGRSENRPPRPTAAQGKRGGQAPATPAQAFADALGDLFV